MSKNYNNIIGILDWLEIPYQEIEHDISHSCDESKIFRQEKWLTWLWSKNIIFHCKWNYYLVVTHWEKQIKARNFKHEFGSKDIRFANQDEITRVLDSMIWSIPPFWFDNHLIKIFVDKEIFWSEQFIFNPSDPTKSVRIWTPDLKKVFDSLENEVRYFIHEEDYFEILNDI